MTYLSGSEFALLHHSFHHACVFLRGLSRVSVSPFCCFVACACGKVRKDKRLSEVVHQVTEEIGFWPQDEVSRCADDVRRRTHSRAHTQDKHRGFSSLLAFLKTDQKRRTVTLAVGAGTFACWTSWSRCGGLRWCAGSRAAANRCLSRSSPRAVTSSTSRSR